MTVFGMIAAPDSGDRTPAAVASFFAHTPLAPEDRFILIDNSGDAVVPDGAPRDRVSVMHAAEPKSFAQSANLLLAEARSRQADLCLLSNRVTFTEGWLAPLAHDRRALLCADLTAQASPHRTNPADYETVGAAPLACARLPRAVYDAIGTFDEALGDDTAAERDYAIRAWIAGIPQEIARGSRVSYTPASPEAASAATAAFDKKWGASLTRAFLTGDWSPFLSNARLAGQIQSGQFTPVVRYLRSHPSLDAFRERRARPRTRWRPI